MRQRGGRLGEQRIKAADLVTIGDLGSVLETADLLRPVGDRRVTLGARLVERRERYGEAAGRRVDGLVLLLDLVAKLALTNARCWASKAAKSASRPPEIPRSVKRETTASP